MIRKKDLLTDAERMLMEYFWTSIEPLTGNDLLRFPEFENWTSGYLHNVIRSMLKKKVIQVDGLVQSNTQYARTFTAALTREEYAAKLALSIGNFNDRSIIEITKIIAKTYGEYELQQKLDTLL